MSLPKEVDVDPEEQTVLREWRELVVDGKLFELFMLNSDHIERVTFWGILDQYSWINDWPVKGRTASPLLFDRDYKAKPAYTALKVLNN